MNVKRLKNHHIGLAILMCLLVLSRFNLSTNIYGWSKSFISPDRYEVAVQRLLINKVAVNCSFDKEGNEFQSYKECNTSKPSLFSSLQFIKGNTLYDNLTTHEISKFICVLKCIVLFYIYSYWFCDNNLSIF